MTLKPSQSLARPQCDRLIDLAYARLRREVIRCEMPPGVEVSEAQLAERYGLGKAAARAALMRLVQDGLAAVHPRRGYQIAPVTIQDIREIFQLRGLLEPMAVRLAVPHVDAGRLRKLDAVCARGYEPGNRRSEELFLRANRDFHLELIRACGNERLVRLLSDVIDQMERLFHLGLGRSVHGVELREQHSRLLAAVTARNEDEAATVAAEHIATMRRAVVDGVMASGDVELPPVVLGKASGAAGSGRHDAVNGTGQAGRGQGSGRGVKDGASGRR